MAEEVSGRKLTLQHKEARSGEQKITQGDPTKAMSEIGFKNSISLEEGLHFQMEEILRNIELYQKLK
jgi:GDP-D-mannose dehydratase